MRESINNIIYIARRFKTATAFNLVGLVLAFATFYLLMTQIIFQVTYNHSLRDHERLYRMETDHVYNESEYCDLIYWPFAEPLSRMPEVESVALSTEVAEAPYQKGDSVKRYLITDCNNTAVSTLTDKVVDGSIEWTDDDQSGCVIPASIAKKHFGTIHAVGDSLTRKTDTIPYGDTTITIKYLPVEVRGVYEDFPVNSDGINCIYYNIEYYIEDSGYDLQNLHWVYRCDVKFKSVPKDLDAFGERLKQAIMEDMSKEENRANYGTDLDDILKSVKEMRVRFTPLDNIYFEDSSLITGNHGYTSMLIILELASLLVILIAAINFLNFTLAESPMRVRSLNTRRVLGASRRKLRLGIITECILTSVVAWILALLLCALVAKSSVAAGLTEGSLALADHWPLVLLMLVIAVAVGIVAGVYPATYATSFAPATALKGGNFGLTPKGHKLRTALVTLQLIVSLMMIIYIGILFLQRNYIFNSSYGYNKDQIFYCDLTEQESFGDIGIQEKLHQELTKLPDIEGVSLSNLSMGSTDAHNGQRARIQGHPIRFCQMFVSGDYMRTMGIEIIEGRDFTDTDTAAIIINEAARKEWDWMELGKTKISTGVNDEQADSAVVVGVCKDIRYGTMRSKNDKFVFIMKSDQLYNGLNIRLKQNADYTAVGNNILDKMRELTGMEAGQLTPFDKTLTEVYHGEFRYTRQVVFISIICLIITLIGVFCLTIFETEYRRKEIGIRKVLGATSGEIIRIFCRHYTRLLLISFVIAAPAAWFFGELTLNEHFVDRTSILSQWWIFPLALALVGIITLGTVVLQCWRTARENPVNSIKTE